MLPAHLKKPHNSCKQSYAGFFFGKLMSTPWNLRK